MGKSEQNYTKNEGLDILRCRKFDKLDTWDGFTITIRTINDYPCEFTVKYHENMWPFAVEEYVE